MEFSWLSLLSRLYESQWWDEQFATSNFASDLAEAEAAVRENGSSWASAYEDLGHGFVDSWSTYPWAVRLWAVALLAKGDDG